MPGNVTVMILWGFYWYFEAVLVRSGLMMFFNILQEFLNDLLATFWIFGT